MKIADTFVSPDSFRNPLMPLFLALFTKAKAIAGAVVDPLFLHKAIAVESYHWLSRPYQIQNTKCIKQRCSVAKPESAS